jgi:hypothetical protein
MAELTARLDAAEQAIDRLAELTADVPSDPVRRDAAILRFVFAFETTFAAARHYLHEIELVSQASPAGCIRACRASGLIGADQAEISWRWRTTATKQCIHTTRIWRRPWRPACPITPVCCARGSRLSARPAIDLRMPMRPLGMS